MATRSQLLQTFIQLSERAYNNVYSTFERTAQLEAASLTPAINDHAFVARAADGQLNSVEVRGALRIDNLPYKRKHDAGTRDPSSHAGGINVVLDSLDIYKFDRNQPTLENSFLYKSTVRVAYFKRTKAKWRPHLCVRYDFTHSYGAHPIFHAQLENGIPNAEVRARFPDMPEVEQPLDLHTHVRLPTANVVGATALLSLAADHLPMTKFPDVLRAVRAQALFNANPWRCDYSSLDHGTSPETMLASRWYSLNMQPSGSVAQTREQTA
jgi:hypothetical protein